MTDFTRFDKIVSDALIDRWEQAEKDGDEPAAEAIKRALAHLGLPWVRLED